MSGWYEVSQANDGQYRFVLKAGNGEVILTVNCIKQKRQHIMELSRCKKIAPMIRVMNA